MSDLTTSGAQALASLTIADGVYPTYASATAYIGVGDSVTAFSTVQTDLQAASNKLRKSATASRSTVTLTFSAAFETSEANYAWNEVGVFNAASSGTMLVRKVAVIGTKTSAERWTLDITVAYSA